MISLAQVDSFLDSLRKHILNIVTILVSLFIVFLIVKDMYGGGFEVETIEVPSSITGRIAGSGAAEVLLDGIGREWHKAVASSPINVIRKDDDEPVIAIGNTNLPLRYVAKLLRRAANRPIVELSGQMLPVIEAAPTSSPGSPSLVNVRLILRNSEALTNPYFDQTGPMDGVMEDAALASLEQIDAYAAVLAGSQGSRARQERALRLAKVSLAREAKQASHGRGYLAEATALYKLGYLDEAETSFKKAVTAFTAFDADSTQLSVAEDGLAIIYTNRREWDRATEAVRLSLAAQKNFDSALYHRVEIDDYKSRGFFGENGATRDFCTAEIGYQLALAEYREFIDNHPGFLVAFTQLATMKVIHLRWRRMAEHQGLVCSDNLSIDALDAEIESTRRSLQDAVDEDATNPYGWYESANFYYEQQDQQYLLSKAEDADRLALIEASTSRYRTATSLDADNFYFWYRLGEALSVEARLNHDARDAILAEATMAYCRSIETNRTDPGYKTAAQMNLRNLGTKCTPH